MKRILFFGDSHHPYNDRKAWKLLLKVGKDLKPDILVCIGDLVDFYQVSSYQRDPNRRNFDYEIDQARQAVRELDALGCAKKVFIAGNHEDRLERYLVERAPELFNVVRVRELLGLTDWEFVPYKGHTRIGKLYVTHDVGVSGKYATHKALDAFQDNIVTGHTHRFSQIIEGNAKGKPHVSVSFGHLCDVRRADYMHRIKADRDWALGFGVGYLLPNGVVHLSPIPIVDGKAVVEGKLYA